MKKSVRAKGLNDLFMCPCCGYATLEAVADFEICDICFWEDDGQDELELDCEIGGPNGVSLAEARGNFIEFGAAEKKDLEHTRLPNERDEQLRSFR